MSITDVLRALEASGKVVRIAARSRHNSKRRLYLADGAIDDFYNAGSAVNTLVGRGYIEASLMRWVTGGRIYGTKRGGSFLKRLDPPPPEIWEMRVTEPVTQARLFGRFLEADTVVLTKFHTRGLLGKRGSQPWIEAMGACEARWLELFPGLPLFQRNSIGEYVTENCDVFPI